MTMVTKYFRVDGSIHTVSVPEEAEWISFDANLQVWVYDCKPVLIPEDDDTIWMMNGQLCREVKINPYCSHWKQSLRRLDRSPS